MLLVYADGGTRKGKGAWAYAIVKAPVMSVRKDYGGRLSGKIIAHGYGTVEVAVHSSHMELVAVYEGLMRALTLPKSKITVVSDSTYVTGGLPKAHMRAKAAENSVKPSANIADIWRELMPIWAFNDISATHVKGHSKQSGNTLCDYMCGEVLSNRVLMLDHQVRLFSNSKPWRASLVKTRR